MLNNITSFAAALLLMGSAVSAQDNYLDTTFGNAGIVTAELFEPNAMIVQQDGKIVLSAFSENGMVYRFNTDGSPDTGFGNGGKVVINDLLSLTDVAELPGGKILALGCNKIVVQSPFSGTHNLYRIVLTCLNSDGSPDDNFGTNGRKVYLLINSSVTVSPVKMKLSGDGKVYVIGGFDTISFIAKIKLDGGLDTSFFENGYSAWGNNPGKFMGIDIFSNGNLSVIFEGGDIHSLFKFDSDGQLMQGVNDIELGSSADVVNDLKIAPSNKVLVTGSTVGNSREGVLLRLKNNGTPDTTFGNSGRHAILNNSEQEEAAMESVILENGRIVTGCQFWGDGSDFGLAFTTPSGATDTSMDESGKIIINRPGNQKLKFIAQQQDGKIVAVGFDENNMVMMRYDISEALTNPSFEKSQMTVYPNPANDNINISGLHDNALVTLYNISGQKLREVVSNGDTHIDISSLSKGIYFLNTTEGSVKIIKK